jgi:hypothetical protein
MNGTFLCPGAAFFVRSRSVLTSLLWIGLALGQVDAAAPAATSPAATSPEAAAKAERVRRLVVQLDDDSQARRDAAEKALTEMGPELLDLLPAPDAKASIELKARLARIRTAVEKAHIASFTRPASVTLQGKMKLSEALAKIKEQTGNEVVDARERFNQEPDDPTLELNLEGITFWQALDKILDEADLTIYNYNDEPGQLQLMARSPGQLDRGERGKYGGLFRFEATSVSAMRDLRNPRVSSLTVSTDINWEPRVRPIVLEMPLNELKATDETGAAIQSKDEGEIEVPVETTNSGVELDVQLTLPDRSIRKIASLQGKMLALIPGRVETFQFENLAKAKNVAQERGSVVVTLEQVRKNDEIYEVRIRVKFDKSANALESHRGWIYNNEAYMLDAAGEVIENGGIEARLVEENEIGLGYLFDLDGVDLNQARFVYKTPAALFKVPVEFELKDLDLP